MFCTGEAPVVPGISARFSKPGYPWASVQATTSCQFSPAPASTTQALAVSSTSRMPITSTLSTSGFTSPVSTRLLPPPSTNAGCAAKPALAATACTSATLRTRTSVWALATMPKVL